MRPEQKQTMPKTKKNKKFATAAAPYVASAGAHNGSSVKRNQKQVSANLVAPNTSLGQVGDFQFFSLFSVFCSIAASESIIEPPCSFHVNFCAQ